MKNKCWLSDDGDTSATLPVHFWSIGEERWVSSSFFPPVEVQEVDLLLKSNVHKQQTGLVQQQGNFHGLVPSIETDLFDPLGEENTTLSTVLYEVDYEATTRGLSRWVIAKHPFRMPSSSVRQYYPLSSSSANSSSRPPLSQLKMSDFLKLPFWSPLSGDTSTGDLLLFTSPPLRHSIRIAGSPLLRFSLNLTGEFERRVRALRSEIFGDGPSRFSSLKVNRLNPAAALDVTVFGYLEDVDNDAGKVHYVTEGRLLLSHRPTIAASHSRGQSNTSSGLSDWGGCITPPFMENSDPESASVPSSLRQPFRIGSADVVYQSGDQSEHHFSVGMR